MVILEEIKVKQANLGNKLWTQFIRWQFLSLKITASIGFFFFVIGAAELTFFRGGLWNNSNAYSLIELSLGGALGFFFIFFLLSGLYQLGRLLFTP